MVAKILMLVFLIVPSGQVSMASEIGQPNTEINKHG
jgi:hypothetical protein